MVRPGPAELETGCRVCRATLDVACRRSITALQLRLFWRCVRVCTTAPAVCDPRLSCTPCTLPLQSATTRG